MKKTTILPLRFAVLVGLAGGLIGSAQAQQTPKATKSGEVHVKVIERSGDTVTELERTYRADDMTDDKRDELVKNLVDSLKTARKGDSRQRQMTIIIEDNADVANRSRQNRRRDFDWDSSARVRGRDWSTNQPFRYQFRADIDSVSDRLKRLNFSFPQDLSMRLAEPFEAWSREFAGKASTIRGLGVYPNNPDQNLLNVRFTAPAKGDVYIVVTNPAGKEVARKNVKDFSGEFIGQIDLGKNASGAYFVTVTQNEDGAVKRIIVK
ncbi:MAG: T9SS type A sorting domain-containing protein [Bacteroidetes bacterium]|nr:T9SS type A sorting domain-containing protein [Fibrella sp.]